MLSKHGLHREPGEQHEVIHMILSISLIVAGSVLSKYRSSTFIAFLQVHRCLKQKQNLKENSTERPVLHVHSAVA